MSLISTLPDVGLPNGIYSPANSHGLLLLADSTNAVIWRISTTTGAHSIAISDPLFKVPTNASIGLGVNGIKTSLVDDKLWFTNPASGIIGEIAITPNGTALGPARVLANVPIADDFATSAGELPLFAVGDNTLWRVDGESARVVAGGAEDLTLEGATAAALGRTFADQGVLYISTDGGLSAPVGGVMTGGKILAVNVAGR